MYGWWGRVLVVDLSREKVRELHLDASVYALYVGGRGLAVKLLWDLIPPGVDPLSPYNALIVASGPLSGMPVPSSGKLVVASKSPLTNGYGDGNIGSIASYHLKRTGYDALVVLGAARKPVYLYIEDGRVEFKSAEDLWGLDTFTTEDKLVREHGRSVGILEIGPAGENTVRYATVISQKGRSGGRPGIGAVMGSKKLKAIVVKGSKEPLVADWSSLRKVSEEAYKKILGSEGYNYWIRQGTMATIQWSNQNSVLPTMNFREGVWELYDSISGDLMEKLKTGRRGCTFCNMQCGNVILDDVGEESELDYENVAMLGSNILLDNLKRVGELNKLADKLGMDTISLGNSIGFYMEASERGLVEERVEWGDFKAIRELVVDTAYRRGLGSFLAEGVMRMSWSLKSEALDFAMHVKGLEVSAYNCHTTPGMALAYATSPIGAHHKDAWIISYEVRTDRSSYSEDKVDRLISLQDIRGGMFEALTTCRFPWVELGLDLEYYPKMLSAVTGLEWSLEDFKTIASRVYTLIRAFWIREHRGWSRAMDYPPPRWFKHPLTKGPYAGHRLDPARYEAMLDAYYRKRGWDHNGVPRRETLVKLGLEYTIPVLEEIVELH